MIPEMPLDAGVSPGGNRMLDRSRWNSDEAVALVPLESKGFDEEEEGEDWEEEEWEEDDDWDDDDDDDDDDDEFDDEDGDDEEWEEWEEEDEDVSGKRPPRPMWD
jgi:hypothetical protein